MEKTLSKTREFEGKLLTLDVHQVELEDGSHSSREIVLHADAVCCVVLTKGLETILVRQYRKAIEKPLLEIPAGKIDPGEDAAKAAVREIREEVGFQDGKVEHLMDFYSSPGFCNEKLGLFLATEAQLGEQELDDGEFLEMVRLPFAEVKQMALRGELGDAKTVAGILATAAHLRI
jgi:ADP-ribose pyrophosphatase